jgi:hypothetical protein
LLKPDTWAHAPAWAQERCNYKSDAIIGADEMRHDEPREDTDAPANVMAEYA